MAGASSARIDDARPSHRPEIDPRLNRRSAFRNQDCWSGRILTNGPCKCAGLAERAADALALVALRSHLKPPNLISLFDAISEGAGRDAAPLRGSPEDLMLETLLGEGRALLADGATGTNLFEMGLSSGDNPELWNVDRPDRILALHRSFVDAGADIILTNSFGGNRRRLMLHQLEGRTRELNRLAGEIARTAADQAGRRVVVARFGRADRRSSRAARADHARTRPSIYSSNRSKG